MQCQSAESQRDNKTCTFVRIGQRIKNSTIGQGLTAAGRGHVDAKKSLLRTAHLKAFGQIKRPILPAESIILATLTKPFVAGNRWQVMRETGQGLNNLAGINLNTDQVLIQSLLEISCIPIGIGEQWKFGIPVAGMTGLTGVVVVGQYQRHAGQM